jgi:ATP-dependent protease Clp ATPase subunit
MIYDSPTSIKEYLDQDIIGNEDAKWSLANAFFLYERKMWELAKNHIVKIPTNVMLIGPSSSGKTALVERLAEAVSFPLITIDCSTLTKPGYAGLDISESLTAKLSNLNRNDMAILLLDEVDKICTPSITSSGDDHNAAIQGSLLGLLDGKPIHTSRNLNEIPTDKFFIVACGAFQSLKSVSGYKSNVRKSLVTYGMREEFCNRFIDVTRTESLDIDKILELLFAHPNSPIVPYREIFKECGQEITLNNIERGMIKNAIQAGQVRELHSILFNVFKPRFKELRSSMLFMQHMESMPKYPPEGI